MPGKDITNKDLMDEISSVKKILLGNGEVGFLEMVRNNTSKINTIEADIKKSKFGRKDLYTIIGFIITIGVAFYF